MLTCFFVLDAGLYTTGLSCFVFFFVLGVTVALTCWWSDFLCVVFFFFLFLLLLIKVLFKFCFVFVGKGSFC